MQEDAVVLKEIRARFYGSHLIAADGLNSPTRRIQILMQDCLVEKDTLRRHYQLSAAGEKPTHVEVSACDGFESHVTLQAMMMGVALTAAYFKMAPIIASTLGDLAKKRIRTLQSVCPMQNRSVSHQRHAAHFKGARNKFTRTALC